MKWLVIDRVSGTLSRYSMCFRGARIAVAVSGGADSVCLLHVLTRLAPDWGLELSVAHLNHNLRGTASVEDADFVRHLAASLGLPFHVAEASLTGNLEQAGRNARLAFFDSLPVDRVATGHTQSDQAETVIYRLLRGAGTAGLAGIRPVAGRLIRPLIHCSREDVLKYLRENRLEWREDATNQELTFARNRIRQQVLPLLIVEAPNVEQILARTADIARDEEAFWEAHVEIRFHKFFHRTNQGLVVSADELRSEPIAMQRRLLRRAVRETKGDLRQIDVADIERMLGLTGQTEGHGRTQVPGVDVFRSFEWLLIAPLRQESRSDRDYCFPMPVPGSLTIPRQPSKVRVEVAENTEYYFSLEGYNNGDGLLDADRLVGPVELRNWRPGDQIVRLGHAPEKIKTLFQVARVPIWNRQGWPVITSGDRIMWTRKFGVDAGFAARPDSRRVFRVLEEDIDSAESKNVDSASLY